jgi:hypothetical protein
MKSRCLFGLELDGLFSDVGGGSGCLENGLEPVLGGPYDSVWLREPQDVFFLLSDKAKLEWRGGYGGLELEAPGVSSLEILDFVDLGHLHNVNGVVLGLVPRAHFSVCPNPNPLAFHFQG